MMAVYYNEIDPFAAAWLRELMKDDLIAPGEVDERSIEDVTPDDLRPFQQCHFFAGIGIWSLAARLAGIADDAPLWSGSCPCQPFSAAGKGGGFTDERHLWPAFHYLIEQQRPSLIVGEQVAGADGDAWLDLVSADMDATGYAFGAAETCAAGFGAPHIRSRNYWVAHPDSRQQRGVSDGEGRQPHGQATGRVEGDGIVAASGEFRRLAERRWRAAERRKRTIRGREHGLVTKDGSDGRAGNRGSRSDPVTRMERPGPVNGLWRNADWLFCRDEKWRPVESGTFPLADAGTFRNRVGLLRGAGNAITLGQAQGFLEAVIACRP